MKLLKAKANQNQLALDSSILTNISAKYYRLRNETYKAGNPNMKLYILAYSSDETKLRNFRTHIKRVKNRVIKKHISIHNFSTCEANKLPIIKFLSR